MPSMKSRLVSNAQDARKFSVRALGIILLVGSRKEEVSEESKSSLGRVFFIKAGRVWGTWTVRGAGNRRF